MNESLFHGDLVTTNRILYTPSEFARRNLIHLQEVGLLTAKKQHICKRNNLTSFLFFIVEKGAGTLEYMDSLYDLHENDCVFINCKCSYAHYTSENNLWRLSWAHFYGSNLNSIYDKYLERGGTPTFHPHNIDSFLLSINELYEIANSTDYIKDMLLHEKLSSLLTQIMKESWHPEQNRSSSPKKKDLINVKEYIDTHYSEKISLDDLSAYFYINKYYLTRIFKEQYGLSINNYIIQQRITVAKQLLRFTEKNIESICTECGINNPNYFTRAFKKVEGLTPSEYRKMW